MGITFSRSPESELAPAEVFASAAAFSSYVAEVGLDEATRQFRAYNRRDVLELDRRIGDTAGILYHGLAELHEALISRKARRRLRREIRMSDGLLAWAGTTFEERRTQAIVEDHLYRIPRPETGDERARRADARLAAELEHYDEARDAGEITRRQARFLTGEAHRRHAEAVAAV